MNFSLRSLICFSFFGIAESITQFGGNEYPNGTLPSLGLSEKMLLQNKRINYMQEIIAARRRMIFEEDSTLLNKCGNGPVRSAKAPFRFDEGEGYIFLNQYGPIETSPTGLSSMRCSGADHLAQPGSYLKGYWYRFRDVETGLPIGYPPLMNHHTRSVQSNSMALSRRSAADFQCKGSGTDRLLGGTYCNFMFFEEGVAYKVPPKTTRDKMARADFYLVDVRKEGAPPLQFYIESYTFWITKPSRSLRSWRYYTFGIDPMEGPDRQFALPVNQSAVHMRSYYFLGRGQMSLMGLHIHSHEDDEGWLVRGSVGELLGLPPHLFREYQRPIESRCDRLDGGEANAIPMEAFFSAVTKTVDSKGRASTGSVSGREVSFGEMKTYLASMLGPNLLCAFKGQNSVYSDDDIRQMERAHRLPHIEANAAGGSSSSGSRGGSSGSSSSFSRYSPYESALMGWKAGTYFRKPIAHGPGCEMATFDANEVFTVLSFSGARDYQSYQHTSINSHISFDEDGPDSQCQF